MIPRTIQSFEHDSKHCRSSAVNIFSRFESIEQQWPAGQTDKHQGWKVKQRPTFREIKILRDRETERYRETEIKRDWEIAIETNKLELLKLRYLERQSDSETVRLTNQRTDFWQTVVWWTDVWQINTLTDRQTKYWQTNKLTVWQTSKLTDMPYWPVRKPCIDSRVANYLRSTVQ